MAIDLLKVHAQEALDIPSNYDIVKYETLNGQVFQVTFCEKSIYKSGKNKGKTKFILKNNIVFMCSIKEQRAWELEWSKKTGKCYYCTGDGKTIKRTYKTEDGWKREYRTCKICNGSGTCVE